MHAVTASIDRLDLHNPAFIENLSKTPVHLNDHVNKGQSTNDVIPSAIHISALEGIETNLLPALNDLHGPLGAKTRQFNKQDAVFVTIESLVDHVGLNNDIALGPLPDIDPKQSNLLAIAFLWAFVSHI